MRFFTFMLINSPKFDILASLWLAVGSSIGGASLGVISIRSCLYNSILLAFKACHSRFATSFCNWLFGTSFVDVSWNVWLAICLLVAKNKEARFLLESPWRIFCYLHFLIRFCCSRSGVRKLFLESETLTTAMVDLEAILVLKKRELKQLKSKISIKI